MLYERKQNQQVLYVIPISSILGKLPLIPVGDTGTIPFSMRDELHEFDGASCDTKPGEGDGCRLWYHLEGWDVLYSSFECYIAIFISYIAN